MERRGRLGTQSEFERFYHWIDFKDGCWVWYPRRPNGRTQDLRIREFHVSPQRIAWATWCGEIDPDVQVNTLCGNRFCVNPFHLIHVDRGFDYWQATGRCGRGHQLNDGDIVHKGGGVFHCRQCRIESDRARRARQKEARKNASSR